VHIPFLHIADAVGEKITSKGLKKVGLLGTKFTMEREFYTQKLMGTYELEVIVPFAAERQLVHDIIYNELVHGVFTEDSKKICVALIKKLEKRGAEGIILGCTELPLLVADKDVDIPAFDTTKIHAQKAVDLALM
ncbi:MAG: amino acid racemase, partial [Bacteroidota bacterium]